MISRQNDVLSRALSHASLSIVGMGKNAGKTTVLCALIERLAKGQRIAALTSIGRDGEAVDVVTGTEKPEIWVYAGTLIATARDMLPLADITTQVLDTTGVRTPLGEVVIVRALSDGCVQLAGPSMTEQLRALGGALRALGADILLIDGAAGRKSLAAPAVSEAAILCAGASYAPDMAVTIADTAYACRLLTLPAATGEASPDRARHRVQGALTDAQVKALPLADGDEITVADGSRVLLSRVAFDRLLGQGIRITVERAMTLCCVCVNPRAARGADYDAAAFVAGMRAAVSVPVLNVKGE